MNKLLSAGLVVIMVLFLAVVIIARTVSAAKCENENCQEENTHTYEVLSVTQYPAAKTSARGMVYSYHMEYYFTYLDENGEFQEVNGFRHDYTTPKGQSLQICIGDENKYVVTQKGRNKTEECLYITEETLIEASKSASKE